MESLDFLTYKKDGTFPSQAEWCLFCETKTKEGDKIHDHCDEYLCDECYKYIIFLVVDKDTVIG